MPHWLSNFTPNHHIPLQPSTNPINIKLDRYEHIQKDEIEKLAFNAIYEIIGSTTSPFSSLVLLVQENYESWHFCLDYS